MEAIHALDDDARGTADAHPEPLGRRLLPVEPWRLPGRRKDLQRVERLAGLRLEGAVPMVHG
jgi:hypothetical protein